MNTILSKCIRGAVSKIVAKGLISAGQRVTSALLGLGFGIVAARLVGADFYGTYAMAMAMAGIAATISTLGVPTQLGREIAMERGGGSADGVQPLVDGSLFILGALVLAAAVAFLVGFEFVAMGISFAIASLFLSLILSLFTGAERVVTGGWIGAVFRPVLALLLLFAMVWFWRGDVFGVFAAQIGAAIFAAITALSIAPLFVKSALNLISIPRIRWTPAHTRYLGTGLILAVTQTLIGLTTQLDIIVMGAFRSPGEVAHYYAAVRAALVVSMFAGMTSAVAAPTMMRQLSEGDHRSLVSTIRNTSLAGLAVTLCAFVVAMLLAPYYLRLYGPDFVVSYPILALLSCTFVAFVLAGPVEVVLRAHRLDAVVLRTMLLAVSVNLVLSVVLVRPLGAWGVAIGTTAQFILMGLGMNIACRQRVGISVGVLAAVLGLLEANLGRYAKGERF